MSFCCSRMPYVYLNIVWTETMVLQSERVSSSAELENSLLTTTTLSASVIPALMRSSKLKRREFSCHEWCWQRHLLIVAVIYVTSRLCLASSKRRGSTKWNRGRRHPACAPATARWDSSSTWCGNGPSTG